RCEGAGIPWRSGLDPADACTATYRWSSTGRPGGEPYAVRVRTVWSRTWVCEPACGSGGLADLERASTFPLTVQQAQAVITR
ncbi:MAG: hypothetical protein OEY23_26480, partial [Acidimicrobiia bacterium]|nr:hypothetical protein [Acidimicrobiia bacterium]